MVEAAAELLKISVKQFLEDAREGRVEYDVPDLMVTQHQKFLDFLTGKWAEGAEARARTRSVKELPDRPGPRRGWSSRSGWWAPRPSTIG